MCNDWKRTEEKLVEVIHLVVEGKIEIKDEILLDKLLVHVQRRLVQSDESAEKLRLLYNEKIFAKIIEALSLPELDVTCKAFGLRLVGMMFESADKNFIDESVTSLMSLVRCWIDRSSTSEASIVGAAGLEMLVALICNDELLEKIVTKELINAVVNCLQSKNVYMSSAAQKFLSQLIIRTYGEKNRLRFPRVATIAKELSTYLLRKVTRTEDDDANDSHWAKIALIILPIIKKICEENVEFVHSLDKRTILNVLSCRDRQIGLNVTRILSLIVCSRLPEEEHVCDIIQEVRSCDDIYIQEFASHLLARSSSLLSEPSQLMLQSILLQSLDSKNKNLLKSVDIIKSYCDYITRKDFQEQSLSRLCSLLSELIQSCQFPSQAKTVITILESIPLLLNTWTIDAEHQRTIFDLHVSLLENQVTSTMVLLKLMKNVQMLLSCQSRHDVLAEEAESCDRLAASLSRYLSHPEWDVRDSALEVVTQLAEVAAVWPTVGESLVKQKLPRIVWEQVLFEDDSYVRASVFASIVAFSNVPEVWSYLTGLHSQSSIVKQILHFASNDSEAIVRREAFKLLASWFPKPAFSDFKGAFLRIFMKSTADSDWEVKATTVAFWDALYRQLLNERSKDESSDDCPDTCPDGQDVDLSKRRTLTLANDLDRDGWCSSLLSLVKDCDVSVRLKAARVLLDFKEVALRHSLLPDEDSDIEVRSHESKMDDDESSRDDVETDFDVVPFDNAIADEVLSTPDRFTVESIMQKMNGDTDSTYEALMNVEIKMVSVDEFLSELSRLDLESLVNGEQLAADLYENNVDSLLDDLLLSVSTRNNNVLDCY